MTEYTYNASTRIWQRTSFGGIGYSDGEGNEAKLLAALKQCNDVSCASPELHAHITDWPSEYHLSPVRHNLLRPFLFKPTDRILELGCGCGAITRYLGETGATVVSIEGSHRRAEIAAERCRDLPNVRIYCDNLADFRTDEKFDYVTLIGVLEYAPLFIKSEDPVRGCIEKSQSFLAEDGTLIIAIENQLGLKYFAGCEEDHTGQALFGLHSLYASNTPITFGRLELLERLRSTGIGEAQFYYPFPDYKLPSVLLSEAALSHPGLRVADLLARAMTGKRSGEYRTIHEHLAWHAVAENGLVAEMANSFLVFARRDGKAAKMPDWFAVSYSTGRYSKFWTETIIRENNKLIEVKKRPLLAPSLDRESNTLFLHCPVDSPYIRGRLWVNGLWKLLAATDTTPDEVNVWMQPWLNFLRTHAIGGDSSSSRLDFLLPAEFIDCTPFNLIQGDDGNLVYIDTEWRAPNPVSASWVVVRGLFYSLQNYPVPASRAGTKASEIISEIMAACGIVLDESGWEDVFRNENAFGTFTSGLGHLHRLEFLLHRPLGDLCPLLSTPMACARLATDLAIAERALVVAHEHEDAARKFFCLQMAAISGRAIIILQRGAVRSIRIVSTLVKALAAFTRRKNRLGLIRAAWRVIRNQGLPGLKQEFLQFTHVNVTYERWIALHDTLNEKDRESIRTHVSALVSRPFISVLMPTYNTSEQWLRRAIESVRRQLYPHWELCIADDASTAPHVRTVLEEYTRLDQRIRVVYREINGHISAASNTALGISRGEFIALLDHDDELPEHALYMVAVALNENPRLDLIYSDEDKIDEASRRFGPYFKPDWNPDLFTGQNMVSHLGVYRMSLVRSLGGFREGYEGSQDWDLALRFSETIPASHIHHIPHILYHWRAIDGSTAAIAGEKPYALQAAERGLREHLERTGRQGLISQTAGVYFRIRPTTPSPAPLVSIVIPTRNGLPLLRRCIESLREKTRYSCYEILVVDNQSDDSEMLGYLNQIAAAGIARVLRYDFPFNYSALNNFAVRAARGSFLCLMNNDIEVISEDWLDEMVGQAARPEIGVVGSKLYYPDDTIQHAGVILGMGGIAGHLYSGVGRYSGGYMTRLLLVQNISAVTAACLVVRKDIYEEVGGLDEKNLPVAFNDVDFCLKLLERGYRNLWTPYAELYHHESATRGPENTPEKKLRFQREVAYMQARWGYLLERDPAHNPNLTLDNSWPYLASAPRVNKPWRP